METAQTQQQAARRRRRFTGHEYHRMAEAGILHEDDRVELIDGEVVEMSPIGGRHARCVIELTRLLAPLISDQVLLSIQNPIRLGEYYEPQPDVTVLRPSERYRAGELPEPQDVLLLIEVSDTSLYYDRDAKLPLYARAGIPEVWIVDLAGQALERHTEPAEDGYRLVRQARRGEMLESIKLPALTLSVDAVLG